MRSKLKKAHDFFANTLKEPTEAKAPIPDHLLGIDDAKLRQLRGTLAGAKSAVSGVRELANSILAQISRSEDNVSRQLIALFHNAIIPSAEEIERARRRREFGCPPGKIDNPLGDQVVWEQLLTRCRGSDRNTVWIISADTDYGIVSGNKLLLNSLLYRDLVEASPKHLDLHCFADLSDGLKEFAKSIGIKDSSLPTQNETKRIKKEIDFWNANTSSHMITNIVHSDMRVIDNSNRFFRMDKFVPDHPKPV